jgi:hypothetical protein
MFSDATCGAAQVFTYDYGRHGAAVRKYIHLYTGRPGDTEIALYCPTTLYRLGVNLHPTIVASYPLRDLCDYDVLDEQLIADGALNERHYKALLMLQADIVDEPILDKIDLFRRSGGRVILAGKSPVRNVEGVPWPTASKIARVSSLSAGTSWTAELMPHIARYKGFEGLLDGLWTTRRGTETFVFNSNDTPVEAKIDGIAVSLMPHAIYEAPARKALK